jgi:predicted RNA-binding Zn-ribbon protein involved in translation (DUF1610 family)
MILWVTWFLTSPSKSLLLAALGFLLIASYAWCWQRYWRDYFALRKEGYGRLHGRLWLLLVLGAHLASVVGTAAILLAGVALLNWCGVCHFREIPIRHIGVASCVLPLLVVMPATYWYSRRRLSRLMEARSPRCVECGYALRGLPVQAGQIRCPECGKLQDARVVVDRFHYRKLVLRATDKYD